jgi:hypothetical protein
MLKCSSVAILHLLFVGTELSLNAGFHPERMSNSDNSTLLPGDAGHGL